MLFSAFWNSRVNFDELFGAVVQDLFLYVCNLGWDKGPKKQIQYETLLARLKYVERQHGEKCLMRTMVLYVSDQVK